MEFFDCHQLAEGESSAKAVGEAQIESRLEFSLPSIADALFVAFL